MIVVSVAVVVDDDDDDDNDDDDLEDAVDDVEDDEDALRRRGAEALINSACDGNLALIMKKTFPAFLCHFRRPLSIFKAPLGYTPTS